MTSVIPNLIGIPRSSESAESNVDVQAPVWPDIAMCPISGKLAYLDVENFGDEQSLAVEVCGEIFKLNSGWSFSLITLHGSATGSRSGAFLVHIVAYNSFNIVFVFYNSQLIC
jgi:hypothetical protein